MAGIRKVPTAFRMGLLGFVIVTEVVQEPGRLAWGMSPLDYRPHRFPALIIQHAVRLYLRFKLSRREVEERLAERGLDIS